MANNPPDNMSDDLPAEILSITDPGERNRDQQLWGDRLMIHVANVAAWLFPILMLAILTQVIARKAGFNQAWLDDAQWWMYGFAMMVGFGYAITTDSHVRVDILHQSHSPEKKARTEIFAIGWLLLPFLALMTDILANYSWSSFVAGEGSDSPNGLHRLYLLKLSLPVLFVLAIIAAWTSLYRNLGKLTTPALWSMCLAALPFFWFVAERICWYVLWIVVRMANPDLKSRRVAKDPLLENSSLAAVAIVLLILIVGFVLSRRNSSRA